MLQVRWGLLNPNDPSSSDQPYDWTALDTPFASAAQWNAQNPSKAPKTIHLSIPAGFAAPKWVLDQIPSCDGLFLSPPQTPLPGCGKATFAGFFEGKGSGSPAPCETVANPNGTNNSLTRCLPMPWNPTYKSAWQTFLEALAARYGSNPILVDIDVGGPTAASTEIILPNDNNSGNNIVD
jgi:hypothetical protein